MHIFEMGTGKQQEQSAETVRQELLDKPKLSLNVPERLSNWMELFYDLAFSASLVSLANLLNAHIIFSTAVKTLLLFIPFWWIWIGHAVFTTRFATDNLLLRVVTLCQMLAVSAMTIELPQAVGKGGFVFTLGYCTARICLLILYLQIWQTIPKAKLVARFYVFGFTPGMLCWAAALFLDHYRAWLWGAGILIDFTVPWIGWFTGQLRKIPVDAKHLPERFGSFISIIIGQLIVSILMGIGKHQWNTQALVIGGLMFLLAVFIWWIYTTFVQTTNFRQIIGSGQPFIYSHLPMLFALVLLAVGAQQMIDLDTQPSLPSNVRVLMAAGGALWILGYLLIVAVTRPRSVTWSLVAFYGGAVIFLGGLLMFSLQHSLSPLFFYAGFTTIFTILFIRQLVYSVKKAS